MRSTEFHRNADSLPPNVRTISRDDRTRTSGPGLRVFQKIADRLGLSVAERITILGEPSRSTYYRWLMKANHHRPIALSLDTLLRISAIIGIYRALTFLFEDEAQGMLWLKGIHTSPDFAGNSPLRSMLEGGLNGLMSVRRYLDAWCSGNLDSGTHGDIFEPVAERDLIFI